MHFTRIFCLQEEGCQGHAGSVSASPDSRRSLETSVAERLLHIGKDASQKEIRQGFQIYSPEDLQPNITLPKQI